MEALVEQRDCEEDVQERWPECLWLVAQNGATPAQRSQEHQPAHNGLLTP